MKCSTFSIFLVLAISVLIVQGKKRDCPCGGLGPGTNPCSCNEIVVKAAKLPKPAAYAPPQIIAQAAALRERLIQGQASGYHHQSEHHHHHTEHQDEGSSGCGCGGKTEESIQFGELIRGRQQVAPSFPPVGDLCHPLPTHPETGEIIERITTVIPARPGKPQCNCPRTIPYQYCIDMINGHPVSPPYHPGHSDHHGHHGEHHHEHHEEHHEGHHEGHHEEHHEGHHEGHYFPDHHPSHYPGHFPGQDHTHDGYQHHHGHHGHHAHHGFGTHEQILEEDFRFHEEDRSVIRGLGGTIVEDKRIDIHGDVEFERDRLRPSLLGPLGPDGNLLRENERESSLLMGEQRHEGTIVEDSQDYITEQREIQITPKVPVDPVSLALAYKTINPPHVIYKGARKFVPEDKLAFGHRTLPTEVKIEKKKSDIAEEKLIVVDKPVVELKLTPSKTVVVGSYDEKEEMKLAELEAVERETIAKIEQPSSQPTEHLVTYGELGYVPVGMKAPMKSHPTHMESRGLVIESNSRIPCGPLGSPVPGYVPGSVVVKEFIEEETIDTDQEKITDRTITERIYEEDESEEDFVGGSEFLSKLRAASRKHGSGPCLF